MKKYLFYAFALLAAVGMSACNEDDNEGGGDSGNVADLNIQFATSSYALDDQAIEVKIVSSAAPAQDMTVGFTTGGTATDADYTLSADAFILKSGQTEAAVTVTPKHVFSEEKTLTLTLKSGSGYAPGRVASTTVTMKSETYVYSFSAANAEMLESVKVTLSINEAGFQAPAELTIPFKVLEGSTAVAGEHYSVGGDAVAFVIPQGGNSASITLYAGAAADMANPTTLLLGVDEEALGGRLLAGQNASITVTVKGGLSFAMLEGKWQHVEFLGQEEFELMTEDTNIPSKNDGYYFEIKEIDGVWTFVQGDVAGDLSNLFRTSTMVYTAPKNILYGEIAGAYTTTIEQYLGTDQMYDLTYFELDPANRSFDNTKESLGKTTIALELMADGRLIMFLRDYDKSPYLLDYYEEGMTGEDFSFYYGFGYVFQKAQE